MSNSLQPHGLCSPWNSSGQNTGKGSLSLLQVIFPTQGLNPALPPLQVDSLPAESQGKAKSTEVGSLSLLQWIFLTQELNQGLLHCRWILIRKAWKKPNINLEFYTSEVIFHLGFPGVSSSKEPTCQCGRCRFDPWVGNITWIRAWQPTPVFLPGQSLWTEEPTGVQSTGSRRVWHDWNELARTKLYFENDE